jgi:hypothetical protein
MVKVIKMFRLKAVVIFIILATGLYGKKDFYYSFVDPDLEQISDDRKQKIVDATNTLKTIRREIKEGRLDVALKQIGFFRNSNKVEILNSSAILLHSEILYKLKTKTKASEAAVLLERAIHDSKINQDDLLEAYRLLVLLKIRLNKAQDAEYYAKAIEHSFDNPSYKVYGRVAMAQIHIKRRDYKKAIRILKRELIEASDLDVATIIADELYDAFILNKEYNEAYELVEKVLGKNIDYYANDSYRALIKVKKLLDANMPKIAIKILQRLLDNASVTDSIDNFKYILANTYMTIAGKEKEYMDKAKSIYEELIQVRDNPYFKRAKMYLDEIIMREGKFDPQMIVAKYSSSESMQQKAMMQELLNSIEDQMYERIIRMRKIYYGISDEVIKRFGYDSMDQIYDMVKYRMIDDYLKTNQCTQLHTVLKDLNDDALMLIVENGESMDKLFGCMLELPNERTYRLAKNVYGKTKNSEVVLYLERVAILLKNYDDAYKLSQKLDMLNDGEVLSKEFLYRFLIYGSKTHSNSMEKFFKYAKDNREFIVDNENNPLIIDFYYQFYLYLLKQQEEVEAIEVLTQLYEKQNEMNARVYSPFIEIELAKYAKLDDDYDGALEYLKYGLNIKRSYDGMSIDRKIDKEDLAQIYYEMAKIYEFKGKVNRYKAVIKKCQNLKDVNSFYKKMCDKM